MCLLFHHEKKIGVCVWTFAALIWRRRCSFAATLVYGTRAVINLMTRIHFTELKKIKKREKTSQQTMYARNHFGIYQIYSSSSMHIRFFFALILGFV